MNKLCTPLLAVCIMATTYSVNAQQVLFTYGTKSATKDEFLKAFNKNPDTTGSREQKIQEYLDMYTNFRLKLQAAYDEKLNTDARLKMEADDFKAQLTENFINNKANINELVHEAFVRSQKDVLVQDIFIPVAKGADTAAAWLQANNALKELQSGKDFGEVAATYAATEAAKQNKGMVGYVTVFGLSYPIENIVYGLKPGAYSAIYHGKSGYHIFKNVNERPAAGKRKVQQILFPVPESFTDAEKAQMKQLADSVYDLLQHGGPFDDMQKKYSLGADPYITNPFVEIGVGEYDADYEQRVFALAKPGDFTAPFLNSYGYTITKLAEIKPVVKDENDVINYAALQEKVQGDNRLGVAKEKLVEQWLTDTKYKAAVYNANDLWAFTDSAVNTGRMPAMVKTVKPTTVLFEFAKQKVTASDWVKFVQLSREGSSDAVTNDAAYTVIMDVFIKESTNKYYRDHIQDFNPAITEQMNEFNDANLLFATMDKHVWSRAAEDSAGLANYYKANKQKYTWGPSLTAIVVTGPDKETVQHIADTLKTNSANWHSIIDSYNGDVVGDSSRFENGQFPVRQEVKMQEGFQTTPESNESGDSYTFVRVIKVYPDPAQRSFDEARGMVINDYQQVLEEKWLKELKVKYPVKVNQVVLKSL